MRAATVVQVLQDFEAPPIIAPRPPTTVANTHIDRFLRSKETHIQSHNRSLQEAGRAGPGLDRRPAGRDGSVPPTRLTPSTGRPVTVNWRGSVGRRHC